jgi:hypothetical protein
MRPVDRYVKYYEQQAGGQIPVFRGRGNGGVGNYVSQQGNGIGDFLRNLFRIALPIVKKIGFAFGKQSLATGAQIMNDLETTRQPIKQVFKTRINEAGTSLLNRAAHSADTIMSGGRGVKAKTRKRKAHSTTGVKRTTTSRRKKTSRAKPSSRNKKKKRKTLKKTPPRLRDIFSV